MVEGNNALTVGMDALACETSALTAELGMSQSAKVWQTCGKCYALIIG